MAVTAVTALAPEDEPLLFEASGSVDEAVLEAVLVMEPPVAGAVMVTVKLVVAPATKFVRAGHHTVPLPFVPLLEALTNVVLVGSRSLTMMLVASFGPRFVTVTV